MADFALLVSVIGGKPIRYVFDQDRLVVGRGHGADLRIEHAAVARSQFVLERGAGSAGEPRYKILPYDTTNPTYVNDLSAVTGTLSPGDVIAVGDIRVVLERRLKARDAIGKKPELPLLRVLLITATLGMALGVGYLLLAGAPATEGAELAAAETRLFQEPAQVKCANPIECDTRAHDAYARGRKLMTQAGADPGNWYRAALELDRAARFGALAARPLPDIADVDAQIEAARARADAEFNDARFRLQRAIATGDLRRQAEEAALLARLVPDERHPYRTKLDAYRRTLPKAREPGSGDSVMP